MRTKSSKPRGNILFLILIAVALFGALSFAVTQTGRASGNAAKENSVLDTASVTQSPSAVKTAVTRLVLSGVAPLDLYFNKPSEFDGAGFAYFVGKEGRGVFHPAGGGAVYQTVPAPVTSGGVALDWTYSLDFEIPQLGASASGYEGNELIAFADGITKTVCDKINVQLNGYSGDTPIINTAVALANRVATTVAPADPADIVLASDAPDATWFEGKAFGCFQNVEQDKIAARTVLEATECLTLEPSGVWLRGQRADRVCRRHHQNRMRQDQRAAERLFGRYADHQHGCGAGKSRCNHCGPCRSGGHCTGVGCARRHLVRG